MKVGFILTVLLFTCLVVSAQQSLTTFILLRHAEKVYDGSKNPALTEQGKRRAENLVSILRNTPLSAVYSTSFTRTRETVEPIAKSKSLPVIEYEAFQTEVIEQIFKDFKGKTVLICGHSNNIPWIANYLIGTKEFKDFEDKDYGNLLIVTVAEKGTASVSWLNY